MSGKYFAELQYPDDLIYGLVNTVEVMSNRSVNLSHFSWAGLVLLAVIQYFLYTLFASNVPVICSPGPKGARE